MAPVCNLLVKGYVFMRKNHRVLSALCALLLCVSVAVPALAGGTQIRGWDGSSYQYVNFGDLYGSSMPKPILWRVLAVYGNNALLLSELALDSRQFDTNSSDWNTSKIKAWLNDTFLNGAFNNRSEFDALLNDAELGRVFLLAKGDYLDESLGFSATEHYADNARRTSSDATAIQNGAWTTKINSYCTYYTRTANDKNTLWQVRGDGALGIARYDRDNVAIRPAVRVDLSRLSVAGGDGTMASPFFFSR